MLRVERATEGDVEAVRDLFLTIYGQDYPHRNFLDGDWLKRAVYNKDVVMLVARLDGRVVGTASVIFDVGAYSDLNCEFGRLCVHPDARGKGAGRALMQARLEAAKNRVHVGLVENRCVHPYSQMISQRHGFSPVGFLPMKFRFSHRESIALFARHFGAAQELRFNHPRLVAEAHNIAHMALENCGFPKDPVVDEESPPYPQDDDFVASDLVAEGLPALIRIQRGRVRDREVFGPMRLQYGFFQLEARQANYILAHRPGASGAGALCGAIGYITSREDLSVRVFELIAKTGESTRFLLNQLLEHCRAQGIEHIEIDVSANAPRLQRTLLEFDFIPAAYVPSGVFHEVERTDVLKMVRLLVPLDLGEVHLLPPVQAFADEVLRAHRSLVIQPEIAEVLGDLRLFQRLNEEQAARLAGLFRVAEFHSGQELFARDAEADEMFVLLSGDVLVLRDNPVGRVTRGECLGENAMLTAKPHSASAEALGDVRAAVVKRSDLRALNRRRPDIGMTIYRNLALGLGEKLLRVDEALDLDYF